MKARHKKADGGKVEKYTPEDNVEREAEERKDGGRVGHHHEHSGDGEHRAVHVHMKRGGRAKEECAVEGKKAKMNLGRPGRKMGGRVGSDTSPLSSAHNVSSVVEHKTDD